jgi:hypothetical protein
VGLEVEGLEKAEGLGGGSGGYGRSGGLLVCQLILAVLSEVGGADREL